MTSPLPSEDFMSRAVERMMLVAQEEGLTPFQVLAVTHMVSSIMMAQLHNHTEFVPQQVTMEA